MYIYRAYRSALARGLNSAPLPYIINTHGNGELPKLSVLGR